MVSQMHRPPPPLPPTGVTSFMNDPKGERIESRVGVKISQAALLQTRQVCNLFQEPVEQPLSSFRIAEEKPDINK